MPNLSDSIAEELSLNSGIVEEVLLRAISKMSTPNDERSFYVNDATSFQETSPPRKVRNPGTGELMAVINFTCVSPEVSAKEHSKERKRPKSVDSLPEYRLTLTRVPDGETAYPINDETPHYEYQGRRSKFGGKPEFPRDNSPRSAPICVLCSDEMHFLSQIDSVEHDSESNPTSVDCMSGKQRWMFGDVDMLYVYYCFKCGNAVASH